MTSEITTTNGALAIRSEDLPADRDPVAVFLGRSASEHTRRTMLSALRKIATIITDDTTDPRAIPWERLRYQHTARIRSLLIESGAAPSSVNVALAALRGVLREAWRLGLVSAEEYHRAIDLDSVRGSRLPAGRSVPAAEVRALVEACGTKPSGIRNAALLAVAFGCGLRRSEIVGLDLVDYSREVEDDPESGRLRVRGKGGKERTVPLTNGARAAVDDWLRIRSDRPGPLFLPVSIVGEVEHRRMTPQSVRLALRRVASRAKVAELSPHDARRTFISDLLDGGVDLATAQALAGHADPRTTARYDRRPERARFDAVRRSIHFPYERRA